MDVLDFNREEPLCCKNYGTWNLCFHCLKGGEEGGRQPSWWITALSDTAGIAMARQPCLLIVYFIFSAFQEKKHSKRTLAKSWSLLIWTLSYSSTVNNLGTFKCLGNPPQLLVSTWNEIMFANDQCSVSTYIFRNWSMTQMNDLATQSHAFEGCIVTSPAHSCCRCDTEEQRS